MPTLPPIGSADPQPDDDDLPYDREFLRQALRVTGGGIFDHDHRTGRFAWTRRLRAIYDWPDGVPWTMEAMAARVHPDDRAQGMAEINRAHDPAGDGWCHTEHRVVWRDGTVRTVVSRSRTLFEGEGAARRPVRTIGIVTDETERVQKHAQMAATIARDSSQLKDLEEQLRQAMKMEAIGRLAGGLAHDFNNLLSVILSFASLVADDLPPGHPSRPDVDEIRHAAERAAQLTRQMLAFSRRQVLQPRLVNINEVLAGVAPMIRRLIGEDIRLAVLPAGEPVHLVADPSHLEQVVLNLVVNARDAMEHGGNLTIEAQRLFLDEEFARTHIDVQPGWYVMVAVTDSGVGMDAETRARIFEPFFTTKGPGRGTGLGLSTVFGIVKQSGGSIWVYSEPGHGTTFKLYFPLAEGDAAEPEAPPDKQAAPARGSRDVTVMLVEDDEQLRRLLMTVLQRAGYRVIEAADPEEALSQAGRFTGPIDLLLTDVVMPGLSGRQLADRLTAARPSLRVLFMSGYTEHSIVHSGVLDPGVDFIPKPITPEALLARVRRALERQATRSDTPGCALTPSAPVR